MRLVIADQKLQKITDLLGAQVTKTFIRLEGG